jgi:hypothetical protein
MERLQALDRADDFQDATGMKKSGIEVMAVTMVAEVEPEDVVARIEKMPAQRQDVERLRTALPAMQQYNESARGRLACIFLSREIAREPYALSAIKNLVL